MNAGGLVLLAESLDATLRPIMRTLDPPNDEPLSASLSP